MRKVLSRNTSLKDCASTCCKVATVIANINITSVFTCDVDVEQSKYKIDGKSLMEVFSLDLTKPIMVRITSDNEFESRKFVELMEEFRTND